jgi:hypothetical protein
MKTIASFLAGMFAGATLVGTLLVVALMLAAKSFDEKEPIPPPTDPQRPDIIQKKRLVMPKDMSASRPSQKDQSN